MSVPRAGEGRMASPVGARVVWEGSYIWFRGAGGGVWGCGDGAGLGFGGAGGGVGGWGKALVSGSVAQAVGEDSAIRFCGVSCGGKL
jgi:hypothetical protein